ncbi:hypothetical protein QP446_11975 [Corynebacterium riegelii]|uniref:hypothetical protein n=1 Tax=Corynebacterium riegelii TaxID=156976 RepID=UPI00254C0AF3|nr:hypothetical protein [Corynebacterium riegelii]MDK7181466.1 hypothetical protein [Corynebacterium riegelii]
MPENRIARKQDLAELLNAVPTTDTVVDQLRNASNILARAISDLRSPYLTRVEEPQFIVADLNIGTRGFEVLDQIFKRLIEATEGSEEQAKGLIDRHSMVVLAALVHHALTSGDASFWDSFLHKFNLGEDHWLPQLTRDRLRSWLTRARLDPFDYVSFPGRDYVAKIYLHAGISAKDAQTVVELIQKLHRDGMRFEDAHQFAQYVHGDAVRRDLPFTLQNLLKYSGERAINILERFYELAEFSRSAPGWEDAFEPGYTASLPEPAFTTVVDLLAGRELATQEEPIAARAAKQSAVPTVHVDLENGVIEFVIPAVPAMEDVDAHEIKHAFLFDSRRIEISQPRDYTTLGFQEVRVPISEQTRNIYGLRGGSIKKIAQVLDPERPFLFLRQSGQLRRNQKELTGSSAYILMPGSAKLSSNHPEISSIPVDGWHGWRIRHLRLRNEPLKILIGSKQHSIPVNRVRTPQTDFAAVALEHVVGLNHHPVLHTIPSITLPDDGATWSIKCTHRVNGTPSSEDYEVYEYEVEEYGTPIPLLDACDDPWVGVFDYSIFRNGSLNETYTINIAEGLKASLTYQSAEALPYRILIPKPGKNFSSGGTLSPAFVTFDDATHSGLRLPSANKRTTHNGAPKTFRVSNASASDTYFLDVQVNAPAMAFRIPTVDRANVWRSEPLTFNIDDLETTGLFELRFPEPAFEVSAHIIEMKAGTHRVLRSISLSSSYKKHRWQTSVTSLTTGLESGRTYVLAVSWYKETEYDAYVRQNSNRRGKFRPGEVERTNIFAPIARLSRAKLLKEVKVDGAEAVLTAGRTTERGIDLRAWLLFEPEAPAQELKVQGNTAELPETLLGKGPLIFDAKEKAFLSTWASPFPSRQAFVVDDGTVNSFVGPHNADIWLYQPMSKNALLPGELKKVWETRRKFHHVINTHSDSMLDFNEATQLHLRHNPRASLEVLDATLLSQNEQVAMLLATRLIYDSFASPETSGPFHPAPWIAVLQEMNDLCTLHERTATPETLQEIVASQAFLKDTGKVAFNLLYRQGNPSQIFQDTNRELQQLPVIPAERLARLDELLNVVALDHAVLDVAARMIAHAELIRAHAPLDRVSDITTLFKELQGVEYLIGNKASPELYPAITTLNTNGARSNDLWSKVPYVSLVSMLLLRMTAHELIRPIPFLTEHLDTLAELALHAPKLFIFDLVYAEAVTLSLTNKDLSL